MKVKVSVFMFKLKSVKKIPVQIQFPYNMDSTFLCVLTGVIKDV